MNTGRNALAIVGSEPLVTAGNVQHRRIELLVEGFRKGFTEPFQARCRRRILEGNHDHGPADHDAADHSSVGGGVVLGAKRRAEKQRNQKGENRGAFHDKLIISAGVWGRAPSRACPFAEAPSEAEGEVEGSKPSAARPHTIPLASSTNLRIHCFFTLEWPRRSPVREPCVFSCLPFGTSFSFFFSGRCWRDPCRIGRWRMRISDGISEPASRF